MRIIFITLSLLFVGQLYATEYYVSNSGSNSNSGLSLASAFLTLQHASDQVAAGDIVNVADGNYAGFDHRSASGTAGTPITFKAIGNNAIITSSGPIRNDGINIETTDYIVIDGFKVNNMPSNGNGIRVVLANNCIIRNNNCDGNGRGVFTGFTDDILIENNICSNSYDEHGIYVSNSSDRPIIRYNEIFGNNNIGIHMNGDASLGGDGIISDAMIHHNIIYDNNLAAGINMDGVQSPQIFNNLIYNNHNAQGIALFQWDGAIVTNSAKIYNNTIIVPSDGRWGILLQDGANVNTEIYNNIIINQHPWRGCISLENSSQFTSNFNIVNDKLSASGDGSTISFSAWQALGFDANSQIADPLTLIFKDPTTSDYQLISGSQAIDAGTSLVSTIVNDDLGGATRPMGGGYDIGAYELSGTLPGVPLLDVKVYLEGALNTTPSLGMHDTLYQIGILPDTDPYTNTYVLTDPSILANGYVDWVWVEIRNPDLTLVAGQAGLLKENGHVVSIDELPIDFGINPGMYHVFVLHRNHLPLLSPQPLFLSDGLNLMDLTTQNSYTGGGSGQKEIRSGVWAMFVGDAVDDLSGYDISGDDKILWSTQNGNFLQYLPSDFNMDGDVNGYDRILLEQNFGVFSGVPK